MKICLWLVQFSEFLGYIAIALVYKGEKYNLFVCSIYDTYLCLITPHMFCLPLITLLVCPFMTSINGIWLKRYAQNFVFAQISIHYWHKLLCAKLMTDLEHTNLYQMRTLTWSRNSYDMQPLCLCRSLSHGHDWALPSL